jgi:hypothetical protein
LIFDIINNTPTNPKGTNKPLPQMGFTGEFASCVGSVEGWAVEIGVLEGMGVGVSNMVRFSSQ